MRVYHIMRVRRCRCCLLAYRLTMIPVSWVAWVSWIMFQHSSAPTKRDFLVQVRRTPFESVDLPIESNGCCDWGNLERKRVEINVKRVIIYKAIKCLPSKSKLDDESQFEKKKNLFLVNYNSYTPKKKWANVKSLNDSRQDGGNRVIG